MKKLFYSILPIIMITLVSCTGAFVGPRTYTYEKTKSIPKPFDRVWSDIITFFGTNNIPVKNMEKSSGFIASEYYLDATGTDICDCGQEDNHHTIKERAANFNIMIERADDNNTKIAVNVFFRAIMTEFNAFAYPAPLYTKDFKIDCNSNGKFEEKIFNYLNRQ